MNNYCEFAAWECDLLSGGDYGRHCPTHHPRPRTFEPAAPVDPVSAVYKKYADAIDKMYEQRTRGDYSSIGILSEFVREYEKAKNA